MVHTLTLPRFRRFVLGRFRCGHSVNDNHILTSYFDCFFDGTVITQAAVGSP
nr:MAG TPA: hypothetical protein [Caudoviricetes sp.]